MPGLNILRGVAAIVPVTFFVTVSFFVLVVARKVEGKVIKGFGYVTAVLLWISALLMAGTVLFESGPGQKIFSPAMRQRMEQPGMSDWMKGPPDRAMMDQMMRERPDHPRPDRSRE